ncbi:hypothetical protein CPB83DRAFT_222147 [Crepidotus variabilis]|uniref:Uncharacterized protein n=1 Tax=Crepidotus variabilis TaxID=179855 RepID=A0A9P6ETE7_9AGAR|nr:hypothetical protein CPB83DRAFT_222147 [Crepidotus variabilis]
MSLWLWTKRIDDFGPTNRYMESRLWELCKITPDPGSSRMQGRATQCPTDNALRTLHCRLLQANSGPSISYSGPTELDDPWCPAEDEIVRSYGRNKLFSPLVGIPWPYHSPNTPKMPNKNSFTFYSRTGEFSVHDVESSPSNLLHVSKASITLYHH